MFEMETEFILNMCVHVHECKILYDSPQIHYEFEKTNLHISFVVFLVVLV